MWEPARASQRRVHAYGYAADSAPPRTGTSAACHPEATQTNGNGNRRLWRKKSRRCAALLARLVYFDDPLDLEPGAPDQPMPMFEFPRSQIASLRWHAPVGSHVPTEMKARRIESSESL